MAASPEIARENGKKGGRPKGTNALLAEKARQYIAERVEHELTPIVDKAIEQALGGDFKAREFLFERGYGKVAQAVDLKVEDKRLILDDE